MNALLTASAPAAAPVAPTASSTQPAAPVAVAVAAPAEATASADAATPFVRWLADAAVASVGRDDVPLPAAEGSGPALGEDVALPVAWPATGAPDGLVRLGTSLSAAVPVSPSAKAPIEATPRSDDEAKAASDPSQAATPPVAVPVALPVAVPVVLPGVAVPVPAAVPLAAAPAAATLPTRPVTLAVASSTRAPTPVQTSVDDDATADASTSDQPTPRRADVTLASARASMPGTDPAVLASTPAKAPPSASVAPSTITAVDTAAAAPRGPSLAALLALPSAAAPHDGPDAINANLGTTTPISAAPAPLPDPSSAITVKLPATPAAAWQAPLLDALGDHVRLQLAQRSEQAVIRLDPPSLGTVEIVLRHEAGVLQVQLSASHTEVQRQLLHIADSLRQDLSQRQYSDVSVQVASSSAQADSDGRQRQAQRQQAERDARPGRSLASDDAGPRFTLSTTAE